MIEDYGLEYTDKDIALEMKLAYLFFIDSKNDEYFSGAMLQGKKWFDLFLNRHSYEFIENKYNKSDAVCFIKKTMRKLMIGINLNTGKHAMVYCPADTNLYRFFNPHYEKDKVADFFVYSEEELLRLLDEEVLIGYVSYNSNIKSAELDAYCHSGNFLDKYVVDIIGFCSDEHTRDEILEVKESLFAGLMLSPIPLLEFEKEEEIVKCLKKLQLDFVSALKQTSSKIKLANYINPLELNSCVRKLKDSIKNNTPPHAPL